MLVGVDSGLASCGDSEVASARIEIDESFFARFFFLPTIFHPIPWATFQGGVDCAGRLPSWGLFFESGSLSSVESAFKG